MKSKSKNALRSKAQGALEMLIIFGILIIVVVIIGYFYIASHNKILKSDISTLADSIGENLEIPEEHSPSSAVCGNFLCEPKETSANCPADCSS